MAAAGGQRTLKGDQLAAALEQQSWDPSVKSLVAFPQILKMMDGNLTVMVGSGRPLNRGHILLRSDNPTVHPRIFPEYFFRAVAATRSWRAAIPGLIALAIITGAWIISPAKSTPHSAGGPQQHRRLKRVALSQ